MTTILPGHPDADVFAATARFHLLFKRWQERLKENEDYRDNELDDLVDDLTVMKPATPEGWVAMGGAVAAWSGGGIDGTWLSSVLAGMRAAAGQVPPVA